MQDQTLETNPAAPVQVPPAEAAPAAGAVAPTASPGTLPVDATAAGGIDPQALAANVAATGGVDPQALDANPYGIVALWTHGDLVIQGVAVILLLMSIASWYIILSRMVRSLKMRRAARAAARFWHAERFEEGLELLGPSTGNNPFRHVAMEGVHARDHHIACGQELHAQLSLADWLVASLRNAIDETAERMQSGLSILASVGSTAPFVGLFGTVWGIYHALVGIGISGQASIDQVAGPVGEALIMTAFGLAVAIPAVLGYNMLVRWNKRVLGQLHRFAHQLHAYLVTGSAVKRPQARVAPLTRGVR